jgi:hypothetical protein
MLHINSFLLTAGLIGTLASFRSRHVPGLQATRDTSPRLEGLK